MLVIIAVVFPQICSAATSLTGTTGLVNIPTAYIIPDGKMALGVGYTNKEYSLRGPKYKQMVYYATVGYFPFIECSFRISVFPGRMDIGNYGSDKDRAINIKLHALSESHYIPSILLGINDFMGTGLFHSEYVVISKSLHPPIINLLDIHMGYAANLIRKSKRSNMSGVFGGVEIHLSEFLAVIGEYDTEKYNAGLRIMPFGDKVNIDIDVLGMKYISGGTSFSFGL